MLSSILGAGGGAVNSSTAALESTVEAGAASNAYSKMTVTEILQLPAPASCGDLVERTARVVDSIFYDVLMDSVFFLLGVIFLAGQYRG